MRRGGKENGSRACRLFSTTFFFEEFLHNGLCKALRKKKYNFFAWGHGMTYQAGNNHL
jgi:hypothetical protein